MTDIESDQVHQDGNIQTNQEIDSDGKSRNTKRFFYTSETDDDLIQESFIEKEPEEPKPTDYDGQAPPPGSRHQQPTGDQPQYYAQQWVAGQPIYQYGPPPPPMQGGRMGAVRSGQDTATARMERGQRQHGGFSNFFASRDDDSSGGGSNFEFDTVEIRNGFVRKVYALLTIQLLITFGFIFLAIHVDPIRIFLLRHQILLIVVMCLTLVFVMAIVCCESVRKTFPLNLIALGTLTLLYAYMLAAVSCIYDTVAVYMATGTTALVCLIVSILACQIKWDITQCGCLLYVLLLGLMIYGLVCTILMFFVSPETFKVMHLVYGGIGLAVFILYLMYDTQLIMGGRYLELSPEEYILGALKLYIDIIMIFQFILMFFRR